jgi:Uri superfamily endonuclease
VGSAFGPGGLRARIERHKRSLKRQHWHIDYLLQFTNFENVWYSYNEVQREHQWIRLLFNIPGIAIPIKNFGSSDCKCISHLFYSTQKPLFKKFHKYLNKSLPEDEFVLSLSFKGRR